MDGGSRKNKINVRVGDRIRAERKGIGLSQEAFAHKAKIDRSYVGRIERGEINITLVMLEKIARALGNNVRDLL